jgi:hypothetical protein
VKQRVRKGGHDIPDEVQQRRFGKGLRLLLEHYRPLLNDWRIYDNTGQEPLLVVGEEDGRLWVRDASMLAHLEAATNLRIMANKPIDRVEETAITELSWETRASMRAMRKAYADVILENLAWGLPVIQWRDGIGVVEVPAEQLEPLARRILETNGEPLPPEEERAARAPQNLIAGRLRLRAAYIFRSDSTDLSRKSSAKNTSTPAAKAEGIHQNDCHCAGVSAAELPRKRL